jgi:hypothetical protein
MIAWKSAEQAICRLLGMIHIFLAAAVIIGGNQRFPAPNYDAMLHLTHGHAWPYGIIWLIGGLTMLLNTTMWRIIGCTFIVFVSSLWAGLFAIAAYQTPTAAFTPIAAYSGYALLNATMAWLMGIRVWGRRNGRH